MRAPFAVVSLVPVAAEAAVALLGDASPPISSTPFDPVHLLYAGGTALMGYLLHQQMKRSDQDRAKLDATLERFDASLNKLDKRVFRLEVGVHAPAPLDSDPNVAKGR